MVLLVSCAPDLETDISDGQTSAPVPEETTEHNFPENDYGGFEFRILARDNNWDRMEVDFDESQSDPIYDAVYRRNLAVEELYNVKITGILTTGDIYGMVTKSYNANDHAYDLVLASMADSARLGREGFLRSFTDIRGIDIKNSWWDRNIYNDLSLNGNIYFMTGDMNVRDNDNIWIVLFNKKLLQDLNLESPYELVKNGRWTFDKMAEMGKAAVHDMNGDGIFNEEDRYGLITTTEGGKNFFYAAGLKVIEKNSAGELDLALMSEHSQNAIDKINEIFNRENLTFYKVKSWEQAENMFAENHGLFYGEIVTHIINLRHMETDFGILPTPKYNEEQKNYYTHIASNGTALTMPNIIPDEERTGNIIEALGYYGQKYLTPAFNEVALVSKYSRDDESAEMLDIIWNSVRYDFGYLFNIGGMSDITTSLISRDAPENLQATYEKNLDRAQKDIASLIDSYNRIED
ncbi:MAG: hypothetical protein FWD23_01995 [Oscillospiraceae bacterium]|nr:hypothetical protein [Oscillospiraceae bacterium]